MNNFDFSLNNTSSAVRTSRRQLTPFTVHTVKFEGAEIKEVGKDTKFKVLSIVFGNETGSANMSIFWPTPKDAERVVRTASDGHEYETPSRWEQTKAVIAQTLAVLNPKGFEKFQELSKKFRNFDDMAQAFVTVANKSKGVETNVKFSGYTNKAGYPQLSFPNIVAVNKDGEIFTSDNYIGDVALSAYEIKKAEEAAKAKPTEMKKDPLMDEPTAGGKGSEDDGIDFNSLL